MVTRDQLVEYYFRLGLRQVEIIAILGSRHNEVISGRHLRRLLKSQNLHTRKGYSGFDEIVQFIESEIQQHGRLHGYRWMYIKCLHAGLTVRKEDVRLILGILDPIGVTARKKRHLRRRKYFAKGPNFIWHFDGYDKLKPFGICISGCIDGFSRHIMWLRASYTNKDPRVIGTYFTETINLQGGVPRIVRGDMGTENGHVEQIQRFLRRNGTDRFAADKSFMYFKSTANQRIEAWWGILRKEHAEFWIEFFAELKNEGLFDGGLLDKSLIQFCFMNLIQAELDQVVEVWNAHIIRPVKGTCMPSGRPTTLYNAPELYDTTNCIQAVELEETRICEEEIIFTNHCVCADTDIFEICNLYMQEHHWRDPKDAYESTNLYFKLRTKLLADLIQ